MSLIATFDVSSSTSDNNSDNNKNNKNTNNSIRHSIYLGSKVDAKDYTKLVDRWKITHILNMTPPKIVNIDAGVPNYFEQKRMTTTTTTTTNQATNKKTLKYKRIPIYDASTSVVEIKEMKYEQEIVSFISKGLCYGNVFVHCSRGISRSTTALILYFMNKRAMNYATALQLIRRRRPQAEPIPAFHDYLKERDSELFPPLQNQQPDQDQNDNVDDDKKTKVDGDEKEEEQSSNKKKKRKRILAICPSRIGPTMPPSSTTISATTTSTTRIIGPAMGPSIMGPTTEPKPNNTEPEPGSVDVATTTTKKKKKKQTIGPCLPPGM